jgi:hypothetical protein
VVFLGRCVEAGCEGVRVPGSACATLRSVVCVVAMAELVGPGLVWLVGWQVGWVITAHAVSVQSEYFLCRAGAGFPVPSVQYSTHTQPAHWQHTQQSLHRSLLVWVVLACEGLFAMQGYVAVHPQAPRPGCSGPTTVRLRGLSRVLLNSRLWDCGAESEAGGESTLHLNVWRQERCMLWYTMQWAQAAVCLLPCCWQRFAAARMATWLGSDASPAVSS